jgi:hypothetical protein
VVGEDGGGAQDRIAAAGEGDGFAGDKMTTTPLAALRRITAACDRQPIARRDLRVIPQRLGKPFYIPRFCGFAGLCTSERDRLIAI